MKKFVPKEHAVMWEIYWFCAAAIAVLFVLWSWFPNDSPDRVPFLESLPRNLLWLCLYVGAMFLLYVYEKSRGVIIDGEMIIRKELFKKKISPQDIVAIKVARSLDRGSARRMKEFELKDKDGNQLYSMLFLKCYMPWLMDNKEGRPIFGDATFVGQYREYVFCRMIYDQEVIDHLLRLNPNIVIC